MNEAENLAQRRESGREEPIASSKSLTSKHDSIRSKFLRDAVAKPLGHNDVKTTMIYTHVLNRGPAGVRSPMDAL